MFRMLLKQKFQANWQDAKVIVSIGAGQVHKSPLLNDICKD
jgi:hypothetical protein